MKQKLSWIILYNFCYVMLYYVVFYSNVLHYIISNHAVSYHIIYVILCYIILKQKPNHVHQVRTCCKPDFLTRSIQEIPIPQQYRVIENQVMLQSFLTLQKSLFTKKSNSELNQIKLRFELKLGQLCPACLFFLNSDPTILPSRSMPLSQ